MNRYTVVNTDGRGLTLSELRTFLSNISEMGFPDDTRIRVKAKFGNDRGAKLREISVDTRDAESAA